VDPIAKHLKPKTNFLSANYKELLLALIAPAVLFFIRFGVQAVDPTAAVSDWGMVDVLMFACAALVASYAFLWALLRIAFKTFALYLDSKTFRSDFFEKLNPNVRIAATLLVIFGNLLLIVEFAKIFSGVR